MDFNSLLQKRERAVLSERDIDEARKGLVYDHVVRFILANDLAHADLDYKRLINFMARQGLLPPPQEGEPALGKEEAARQIEAAVAGETIEINVPQVQLRSEAETKRIVEERATQELREEERRREEVKYALPEKWRTVERVGRSILSAFGAWSPVKAVTSYDFANALEDSVINLNRHDLRMVEQAERAIDQAPLTAYGGPIAYFMMKAWKVAWEIAEPRDIAITGLTLFKNDGSTLEAPAAGAHRLASDEAKLKLRVTLRNNEAMKAEGNLIVAIGNVSRDDAKKMAEELYPGDPAAQDKWIKKFWISIDGLGYLEFYYAEKGYAPASERLKYVVGLAGKEKTDVDIELPRLPGGKHSLAVRFVDKYSEMPVNMNAQIGAYDVDKLSNGDPDKKTALKTALVNAGFGVATDEDKKLLKAAGIADPGLIPRVIDVGKDLVEVRAIAGPHTTTVSKVTGAEVNTVSTAESYFAQLKLAGTEEARRLVIENFDADEFLKSAFNSGDKRYINEFARKKQGLRDELIRCADLYSNAWTVVDKSRVEARFEKYLKENFSIPRGMEVPITAVVENIGDVQDGIYAYIVTVTDTSTHKVAQRIGYASIKRGPDNKATITFTIKLNKNGDYAGNIAFFPADFLKGDYKDVRDVLSGRGYFKFRVGQLKPQDFTITDAYMPQGVETDKGEIHTVIMATIQNKGKADRAVYIEATDQIVGEETEIIHTSRGITIPAGKSMKIAIPVKLKQGEHTIALALVDSTSEIGDPLMVPTKKPDGTIQHKPLRKLMRVTADTGLLKAYRFEKGPDGKEKRVYLGADEKIGINLRVKGQQHEAMPFFSDAYIQGAQGKKVRLRVRVVNISSPGQVESSFDSEPVNIPSEKRDFKISIPLEKFVELEEGKFKLSYELYEVDPQGSETMLFGMEDNNVFENRVMKVIERSEVTVLPLAKEKAAVQLNKEEDALIKKAASRGVERAYLEREAAPLFLETARQDINRQDDRKALFDKVEEDLKQRMPLSNRDLIDAENLGMDEVVFRNAVWDSPETGAGLDQIVRNVIENRNRELKEKGVEIRNEMQQKVEEQEKDVEARTEAEKLRQGRLERTLNFLNWKVLGSAFGILFLIGLLRKGFRARREARQRRRTSGAVVQLEVEKAQAAVRGDMVAVDQRQQQIDALLDYPQASGAGAVDYKFIELLDNIIGGRGQGETFFVQGDLEQILKTIKGLVDKQKKSGLTRGETKKLVKQKEMLVQVLACINMLSNRREAARRILLSNPKLMGLNNPMLPRTLVEMILRLRRSRVSSMRGVGYLLALGLVTVQSFGAAREFIASTFGVRKMLSLRLDANTAKSWKTFITLKTELSWIQYVIHVWGRWLNGHFLMAAEAYQGGAVYLKPQNISELEEKLLGTPTYDLERKQLTVMGLAAALKRQGYGVAASWLGRKKQERNNYYLWGSSVPIKGMTYVGSTKDLEMFIAQGSWDSAERILTAMGTRGGRTTAGLVLMGPGAGGVEYIMVNDQLWQLEAARPAPKDCNNSTGLQFFFGDITIVVPKTSGSLRGNKTDWADIEIQPGTDIKVPSSMLVLAAAVMDNGVQAEDVGNILRRRHLRDKRRFRAGIARQAGGSVAARAGNFYRQLNDIRLPQLIGYNINAASVRVVNERLLTMEDTLSLRLDVIVRMLAELGIGVVPANMDDVREYFAKLYWQLNDRQRNSVWAWIEQNVKAGDFVRTRIQTRFVDGNDPSLNQDWRNAIKSGRINPFEVLAGCVVTSDVFDARLSRLDFVIKLMKSVYEVRNFGRMWAGLIQRESEKPGAVGRNGVVLGGDTTGMGVANALRDYSGPSAAAANRQRQLAQIQRSLAAAQAQLGQIEAQGAGYLSYQERTKLEIAAKGLRQRISGLNERITAMTTEIAQLPCSDCRAVFEAGAYRDAMDRLKQFGREHKSDGDALSTLSRALSLSGRVFGLSATVNGNTVPLSPLAYAQDPDNPALTNEERACLVNEYMSLYRQQIAYTAETGAGRISETIRTLDEILYAALTTAKGQGSAVDEAFPGFQLADLRKHYFPALTPSEDRIETSRDGDGALEREREKFREEIARINGHAVLQITVGNQTMSFEMVKGERGFYYYPGSLRRLKNRLIEIRTGRTSAMGDEVSPEQIGRLQEGGVPASAFGWIKDPLFMSIGAWYKPEDVIKDAKKRIDREIDTAAAQAASSRLAASGSGETVAIGNIHLPVIGPLASSQAGGGLSWLEIERHIDNFTNNPDIPGNLIALVQVADMEERLGLPDQAHAILGTLADRVVSGTLLAANLERYQSLKYTHNLRELLEREGIYFSLADEEIEAGMRSGLYPLETIADYVNMLNLLELRKTRDRWSRMAGLDAQAGRRLYGIGRECELGLALLMTKEALSRIAKHCPDPQAVALAAQAIGALPQERNDMAQAIVYDEMLEALCVGSWMAGWTYCGSNSKRALRGGDVAVPNTHPRLDLWERVVGKVFGDTTFGFKRSWYRYSPAVSTGDLQPARLRGECTVPFMPLEGIENQTLAQVINVLDAVCKKEGVFAETIIPYVLENNRPRPPKEGDKGIQVVVVYKTRDGLRDADRVGVLNNNVLPQVRELVPAACGINFAFTALSREEFRIAAETRFDGILRNEALRPLLNMIGLARSAYIEYKKTKEERGWRAILLGLRNRLERYAPEETLAQPSSFFQSIIRVFLSDAGSKSVLDVICKEARKLALKDPALSNMMAGNGQLLMNVVRMIFMTEPLIVDLARENVRRPLASFGIDAPGDMTCATLLAVADKHTKDMKERILNSEGLINPERITRGQELDKMNYPELLSLCQDHSLQDESPLKKNIRDAIRGGLIIYKVSGLQGWLNAPDGAAADVHPADWAPKHSRLEPNTDTLMDMMADWSRGYVSDGLMTYISGLRSLARRARDGDQAAAAELTARIRQRNAYINQEGLRSYGAARVQVLREGRMWNEWPEEGDEAIYFILRNVRLLSQRAQATGRVELLNKRDVAAQFANIYNSFINRFGADYEARQDAVRAFRSYYEAVEQLYQIQLASGKISDEEKTRLRENLAVLQSRLQQISGQTDTELAALIAGLPQMTEERLRSGELELPEGVEGLVMAMVHSQILDREAGLSEDMQTLMNLFSPCPRIQRLGLYDMGRYWAMFPLIPIAPGKPLARIPLIPKPFFDTRFSVPERTLPVVGVRFLLGMSPLAACLGGFSRSLFSQASESFWVLVEDTAYGIYAGGRNRRTRPILDPFTPGVAMLTAAVARLTKEEEDHSDSVIRAFSQFMYEHGIMESQRDMSRSPVDGAYLVGRGFIGAYDAAAGQWETEGVFNHILACQSVQRHNDEREMGTAGFMDYFGGGFSWGQLWGSPVSVFPPGIGRAYRDGRKFDDLDKTIPFKLAELYLRISLQENPDLTGGLYPVDPDLAACFANWYPREVIIAAILRRIGQLNVSIGSLNVPDALRQEIQGTREGINRGEIQIDSERAARLETEAREYCRAAQVDEYQTGPVQPVTADKLEIPVSERYWREINAVYTLFNVPTIVTSDKFKELTSAQQEGEMDRGIRQEIREAEAAGREPQFTQAQKDRIELRRKPLWERFIDGVRAVRWREMIPGHPHISFALKLGFLLGAGILLCTFLIPLPLLLFFVAVAGLPLVGKFGDIHRAGMQLVPESYPPWARRLISITLRVAILIGILLLFKYGALTSSIDLGFIKLDWNVLATKWLWNKVFIGFMVKHCFIYILTAKFASLLLPRFERWVRARLETLDFTNTRLYRWYTDSRRSNFTHNMGYAVSKVMLMAFDAYAIARVGIRFGAELFDLTGLPRFFRRRTPAQQPPQAPPPPAPAQPPAPAPMPVPEPAPAQPPAPAPMPVPEPAPAQPPAPAPAHPEETPPAAGPQTYEDVMRAEAIEARDTTRAQLDNTRRFIEHGEFEAARSVINRIGEPIATVEAAGIVLKDDGLEADALSMRQEVKGIIAQVKADIQQNLTGAEGLITAAGEDMADQRQDDASAKMTRANILLIKAQNSSVMLKKDDPLLERLAEVNEMFSTVDAQLAVVEITVTQPPPPGPGTPDIEDQARSSHEAADDVLREASFAETTSNLPSAICNLSLRSGQGLRRFTNPSLIIGIPETIHTPEVCKAVRQKLAAMGRSDVLVIPIDRDQMQTKLEESGVPFGVILDVDNIENIDNLLEPFMEELDLQGLFRDYPGLIKMTGIAEIKKRITEIKINRDVLIMIARDQRLLPKIASLNLEYVFSNSIDGYCNRYPVRKDVPKPKAGLINNIDLFIDRQKQKFNLCNLCLNLRNRKK